MVKQAVLVKPLMEGFLMSRALACPLFSPEVLDKCRMIANHVQQKRATPMAMAHDIVAKTLTVQHLNSTPGTPGLVTVVDRKSTPFSKPLKLIRGLDIDGTYYRLSEDGAKHYSIEELLMLEKPQTLVLLGKEIGAKLTLKMICDAKLPTARR